MSITLINYADKKFYESQKLNSKTGLEVGGFDKVIEYGFKDLDEDFKIRNKVILNEYRLAGYAVWKPYIVLKTLRELEDSEFLFYCDSGSYWIDSVRFLMKELEDIGSWLLSFRGYDEPLPVEKKWCKRDAFILMGCDTPEYTDTIQIYDGFFMIKNCAEARKFFEEWLAFNEDMRVASDIPNECGKENYPEFKDHRHDQAIMSLLVKKWKIKMCDLLPDQYRPIQESYRYPQLINHTRDVR